MDTCCLPLSRPVLQGPPLRPLLQGPSARPLLKGSPLRPLLQGSLLRPPLQGPPLRPLLQGPSARVRCACGVDIARDALRTSLPAAGNASCILHALGGG